MSKREKYYGIKFNENIPKIDEVNKYSKEVEIKFQGKAYLVERKDDEIEKTEIENEYKLKKEGEYEIEFTNLVNETYNLRIKIEITFWFILLPIFVVGLMIVIFLGKPESTFSRFYDFINLAVLEIDVNEEEPHYEFNVSFKNISSDDINLSNTIKAKRLVKNKIAPRSKWKFFNIIKHEKWYSSYEI